jgi:hypothetical protein
MKYLFYLFFLFQQLNVCAQSVAPDFTLTDIHGVNRNLYTELDSGKTIILDFFITNCGTCQINTDTLEQIWQTYGYNGDSVWVWGIEVSGVSDSMVELFDNQFSVTFPTFSTEFDDNMIGLYSITYTPQYFVVCPLHYMKQVPIASVVPNLLSCPDSLQNIETIFNNEKQWFYTDNSMVYMKISQEYFPLDVNIYSSLGLQVYSEKVFNTNKKIDIENLTPGLYIITLKNNSGKPLKEKFIIY